MGQVSKFFILIIALVLLLGTLLETVSAEENNDEDEEEQEEDASDDFEELSDLTCLLSLLSVISLIVLAIVGIKKFRYKPGSSYRSNPLLIASLVVGVLSLLYIEILDNPIMFFEVFIIYLIVAIFVGIDAKSINAGRIAKKRNIIRPMTWGPLTWASVIILIGFWESVGMVLGTKTTFFSYAMFGGGSAGWSITVYMCVILWVIISVMYISKRKSIYDKNTPKKARVARKDAKPRICLKCGRKLAPDDDECFFCSAS